MMTLMINKRKPLRSKEMDGFSTHWGALRAQVLSFRGSEKKCKREICNQILKIKVGWSHRPFKKKCKKSFLSEHNGFLHWVYPETAIAWIPAGLIWGIQYLNLYSFKTSTIRSKDQNVNKSKCPRWIKIVDLLQVWDGLSLDGSSHLCSSKGVQLVPMEIHTEPGSLPGLTNSAFYLKCW